MHFPIILPKKQRFSHRKAISRRKNDQQKHGANGKDGAEHHQLSRQLVIAAHLLCHGERGNRNGCSKHGQ